MRAYGLRQSRGERGGIERAEQPHLEQADLFSSREEMLDGLLGGACARTH